MSVPSLFIRGAIMMIRISITPYFSSVTCGENKDQPKGRKWVPPRVSPLRYISCSSHLIIEIQVHKSWDALGELCHFSHRFNGAGLTAVKETQLQPLWHVTVCAALSSSEICGRRRRRVWVFRDGWKHWTRFHSPLKTEVPQRMQEADAFFFFFFLNMFI